MTDLFQDNQQRRGEDPQAIVAIDEADGNAPLYPPARAGYRPQNPPMPWELQSCSAGRPTAPAKLLNYTPKLSR